MKRDNQHLQSLLNNHTASQWTKKLYNLAGLQMSRVSHAPRQSGARLAELNGVSESQVSSTLSTNLPFLLFYSSSLQIRRGGRWNNDQMTGCYLTSLPFEFMRGQADFEPAYASSYFLARDIQPPERLRQLVWPDLNHWRAAHLQLPEATEEVEPNLATGGFLELLDRLRDVFLQVIIALSFGYFVIPRTILFVKLCSTYIIATTGCCATAARIPAA